MNFISERQNKAFRQKIFALKSEELPQFEELKAPYRVTSK